MWATLDEAISSLTVEFNTAMSSANPPQPIDSMETGAVIPDAFKDEAEL